MALQRKVDPIPPGRYWINVIGAPNIRDFIEWVADMSGAVVEETTELDNTETPLERVLAGGSNPSRLFVIFRVPEGRAPFLNAIQFGFPSKAPKEISSESDTVDRPEPEDAMRDFQRLIRSAVTMVAIGVGVGLAIKLSRK